MIPWSSILKPHPKFVFLPSYTHTHAHTQLNSLILIRLAVIFYLYAIKAAAGQVSAGPTSYRLPLTNR